MKYFVIGLIVLLAAVVIVAFSPASNSLDGADFVVIATSSLALLLGCVSFTAYSADGRARFLFVTVAFFLFFLKGVIIVGSDIFFLDQPLLDMIANLLDFAVLALVFAAIVKK